MQSAAQAARNRLGGLARHGTPADVEQGRRDLAAANLADHIRRVVNADPPLTGQQRAELAALLSPAAIAGDGL